jgi:hypothetical protein
MPLLLWLAPSYKKITMLIILLLIYLSSTITVFMLLSMAIVLMRPLVLEDVRGSMVPLLVAAMFWPIILPLALLRGSPK